MFRVFHPSNDKLEKEKRVSCHLELNQGRRKADIAKEYISEKSENKFKTLDQIFVTHGKTNLFANQMFLLTDFLGTYNRSTTRTVKKYVDAMKGGSRRAEKKS